MKFWRIVFFSALLALCLPGILLADTLYLKNGNVVKGFVEKETSDSIEFILGDGLIVFSKNEISRLVKSDAQETEKIWDEWGQNKKEAQERRPEEERILKEREVQREREEALRKQNEEFAPREIHGSTKGGHFYVNAVLNGKERVKLIVDSGASYVTLSADVAKRLHIDTFGLKKQKTLVADGRMVEVSEGQLKSIEVLDGDSGNPGVWATNVPVWFIPKLHDVLPEAADKIEVQEDGLLGMSFINRFAVQLDYQGGRIIFQKKKAATSK